MKTCGKNNVGRMLCWGLFVVVLILIGGVGGYHLANWETSPEMGNVLVYQCVDESPKTVVIDEHSTGWFCEGKGVDQFTLITTHSGSTVPVISTATIDGKTQFLLATSYEVGENPGVVVSQCSGPGDQSTYARGPKHLSKKVCVGEISYLAAHLGDFPGVATINVEFTNEVPWWVPQTTRLGQSNWYNGEAIWEITTQLTDDVKGDESFYAGVPAVGEGPGVGTGISEELIPYQGKGIIPVLHRNQ